jgi:hypothetical protein
VDHQEHVHSRVLFGAIEAHLADSHAAPAVYLAPSTRAAINGIGEMLELHPELPLVAPEVTGSIAPIELLQSLRETPGRYPFVIICSDQLLGPDVATISVVSDDGPEFLSGLEPVLFSKYGYTLRMVEDGKMVSISPPGAIEVAVSFLKRYFVQAGRLGEAWLASERQSERTLLGRVREARLRAKYFQSAIYHLYGDRPIDDAGRATLTQISDVTNRLIEVGR